MTTHPLVIDQQRELIKAALVEQSISQSQFAKMIGRTEKHVSRVLTGQAGTAELDYWAFVIGITFHVEARSR